jgi:thymidylate synthase
MDENGHVRSNYGWQWVRGSQLDRIIDKLHFSLHNNIDDRQCVISIYDGKEIGDYAYDTPCTLSIHFQIVNRKLCMTVNMRSNDLWYGFCNDQYCFSKLQKMVADEVGIEVGWYYHFTSNMHLYNDKLDMHLK